VTKVSKQLRMKVPSAKSIIRSFKKTGKIFDKKSAIDKRRGTKRGELSDTEQEVALSSEIALKND
jgi:hypothetical protein